MTWTREEERPGYWVLRLDGAVVAVHHETPDERRLREGERLLHTCSPAQPTWKP